MRNLIWPQEHVRSSMKTLLLENDDFMWEGLQEFCESFDKGFVTINVDVKGGTYMDKDDYFFVGLLSQPFVERCIVASAFESMFYKKGMNRVVWQVEHFLSLIEGSMKLREKLKYKPLVFEINYHGVDFLEDVLGEKWGWDFTANLKRIVRQNPDVITFNVYREYKFIYKLTEDLFDKAVVKGTKNRKKSK